MKVVQCWDDGVVDDIRLIEILRLHDAKASFNLNMGRHPVVPPTGWNYHDVKQVRQLALGELIPIYEGFPIANHTFSHPHLTRISYEEAEREIREGRDSLEQHFGRAVKGFAYPFGDTNAAVGEMVKAAGHVYARTCDTAEKVYPPADPMDFRASCHFLDPAFWEKYEQVKNDGNVFYFWGHSYEMVTEADWQDFDSKIRRITEDSEAEWVELPDLFDHSDR